ncbi:hypothetical protein [Apilactobacillus xinyiensis]|uniref:hypothetical protein n=1 Tax=Apilactobacillus xinyiensis TaxID=2841032 RepID=UPI00200C9CB2|nr:hypothetical protein [Apilactobacillus xinyiensis]MCL0330648.1 hypothetical protein [Apilactobacillus xinyiensis]
MNNENMNQTLKIMETKHTFEYMKTYYSSKLEEQKTMYDLTNDSQLLDNMAYLIDKFRSLVARNQPSNVVPQGGNPVPAKPQGRKAE